MNKVQITTIAIKLQKSLGHSAGDINIEEVPRLLKEAPLEAVNQAREKLEKVREAIEAAEAAMDEAQAAYDRAGGWGKAPEVLLAGLRGLQDAWYEAKGLEAPAKEALWGLTQPWFEACGSPEWAGIYLPTLKYSTPKGSSNWDLTGNPRVWIERSKPGQAGLGLKGEEVVTYDFISDKVRWTERAEARHLSEMASLLYEEAPEAYKIIHAEAGRLRAAEVRSEFRKAMLAISIEDPKWDLKWSLLCFGETLVERAVILGPDFYPGMTRYFTTREAAAKFSEALASENYTMVWEAAKLAA